MENDKIDSTQKSDEALRKETEKVILGTAALTAAELAVYALIGRMGFPVFFGGIYGMMVAALNFILLSLTVRHVTDMAGEGGDENVKRAKRFMRTSYVIRTALEAGLLILAITVFQLNWLACFIPLLFPRGAIYVIQLMQRKPTRTKGSEIK